SPQMVSLEFLLRGGNGPSRTVVRDRCVPLSPLGLAQGGAGVLGSFPRLLGAPLSVPCALARPFGRLCRAVVLALRLLPLGPRLRQLLLGLSPPLPSSPGPAAIGRA